MTLPLSHLLPTIEIIFPATTLPVFSINTNTTDKEDGRLTTSEGGTQRPPCPAAAEALSNDNPSSDKMPGSRSTREKDAIVKAGSLEADPPPPAWEAAKDVSCDVGKPSAASYENILPPCSDAEANELRASGLDTEAVGLTRYEERPDVIPVVMQATIQGKDVTYYSTEQSSQNLLLKANVAENEELVTTMYELQMEQAANAREQLRRRVRLRDERLLEFDNGYRWPDPSGLTAAHLVGRMSLRVTMDDFALFGEVTHPSLLPVDTLLRSALQERVLPARRQSAEVPVNHVLLAYLHTLAPSTPGCCHPLWELLLRHSDIVHTDVLQYIKGELAHSGEKMRVLFEEYEGLERVGQQAALRDDMSEADQAHRGCVGTLEKIIGLVRARLSQISLGSSDTSSFSGKYLHNTTETRRAVADLREAKETLRDSLLTDLETLTARGEEAAKENTAALRVYENAQQDSCKTLAEAARRQDDLWAQIHELIEEVKQVGAKKTEQVAAHLQRTEDEERRKRHYVEFSEVYAEHCRRVQEMSRNTATALELLDSLDAYVNEGCGVVDKKDVSDELNGIKETELTRYLEVFRTYSLKVGDLLVKRQGRLGGIRRAKRTAEALLALCHDTHDPNKSKYKTDVAQLTVTEAELEQQITDLQQRLTQHEQDFAPSEELLEELGIDFVPPVIEGKEVEVGKRKSLLQKTKEIVGKEQDEVDKEATRLRKLHTDTSLGREMTDRRREAKKARSATHAPASAPGADMSPAAVPEAAQTLPPPVRAEVGEAEAEVEVEAAAAATAVPATAEAAPVAAEGERGEEETAAAQQSGATPAEAWSPEKDAE